MYDIMAKSKKCIKKYIVDHKLCSKRTSAESCQKNVKRKSNELAATHDDSILKNIRSEINERMNFSKTFLSTHCRV